MLRNISLKIALFLKRKLPKRTTPEKREKKYDVVLAIPWGRFLAPQKLRSTSCLVRNSMSLRPSSKLQTFPRFGEGPQSYGMAEQAASRIEQRLTESYL